MNKSIIAGSLLALFMATSTSAEDTDLQKRANQLANNTLIVDGHIDVPYRLNDKWDDVSKATESGDFDYPRALKGGLNAPFMSIYTPADYGVTQKAKDHAEAMIVLVERIASEAPNKYRIVKTVAEVEQAFSEGIIALPLGMENGSPIINDLANLDYFYDRGIRYVTLTHSKANQISDSSYDDNKKWGGLSDFGVQAVKRMNDLGIMVDISHVSDGAFWQVMDITDVPVIASHSSARKFTPGFERNMDDAMIKALVKNGGVIMINYGSSFISKDANEYSDKRQAAYEAHLAANGLQESPEAQDAFRKNYAVANPYPFATLNDVLDHIDHVAKIAGVDHIGIGSDYDGVGDSLPVGLKDVASYPNLIAGLMKRGYSDQDIAKILSGNVMRVWQAVELAAKH